MCVTVILRLRAVRLAPGERMSGWTTVVYCSTGLVSLRARLWVRGKTRSSACVRLGRAPSTTTRERRPRSEGVLKSQKVAFHPQLPEELASAIADLGMPRPQWPMPFSCVGGQAIAQWPVDPPLPPFARAQATVLNNAGPTGSSRWVWVCGGPPHVCAFRQQPPSPHPGSAFVLGSWVWRAVVRMPQRGIRVMRGACEFVHRGICDVKPRSITATHLPRDEGRRSTANRGITPHGG